MYDCTLYHVICDTSLFSFNFPEPVTSDITITSQSNHPPRNTEKYQPSVEIRNNQGPDSPQIRLREPFYQDFIESNRQSGKLVATEEQSVLAAHMTLTLPHHAEGHMGRSLNIICYRFYISTNTANIILHICRKCQNSAQ